MNILFLDQARNTGYCIYDDNKQQITEVGNWKLKVDCEEMSLYNHIAKIISTGDVERIIAEDIYNDPDKKGAYQKLSGYRAIILMASQAHSLPAPYFMDNIRAKQVLFGIAGYNAREKALAIKGKEGKERVMYKVKSYGYTPATFDEADSLMIAIAYLRFYKFPLTYPNNNPA
jgi:Holliday junction resolvasome RuvABC endonuclease subunit